MMLPPDHWLEPDVLDSSEMYHLRLQAEQLHLLNKYIDLMNGKPIIRPETDLAWLALPEPLPRLTVKLVQFRSSIYLVGYINECIRLKETREKDVIS